MKYGYDKRLVLVDPLLRTLQREYDDALWAEAEDYDYHVAEREIHRLKEAQQKGEMYDPVF
jgi:hypothetical protein